MVVKLSAAKMPFERGAVILSFDTEQIWGYIDLFDEEQFLKRYPQAIEIHENLLRRLCRAGIRATWFVVGGLSLDGSLGEDDPRYDDLPREWVTRVRRGDELSAPLWYRRSFVERLRDSRPRQEIGIHGGLTHLIWTHRHTTPAVAARELARAHKALGELGIRAASFSYPREEEAYRNLLPAHGVRCYRGRLQVRAHLLGRTFLGRLLRLADELRRAAPMVVWPQETLPGLWNIPSSMFLYPLGRTRTRFITARTRLQRFVRGVEAAARCHGIFHFCLHPENLAEHPCGLSLLEDCLAKLVKFRDRGDVEVVTVGEVAERMRRFKDEQLAEAPSARAVGTAPASGD